MDLGLRGRRALVTGGTKGIGRAIVAELVAEGAQVAFCARNEDEVQLAQQEISGRAASSTVVGWAADICNADDVARVADDAAAELGGLDILVNNAGAAHPGSFEDLSDDDWRADLDVNCSRRSAASVRRCLTCAACLNLTKALAQQYGPEGILVNSVNIGFVVTPQWENIWQRCAPESSREDFFADLAGQEVPLGRFGTPGEVSGIVAFLAGGRASYITGASIDVSGGMGKYV